MAEFLHADFTAKERQSTRPCSYTVAVTAVNVVPFYRSSDSIPVSVTKEDSCTREETTKPSCMTKANGRKAGGEDLSHHGCLSGRAGQISH